MSLAAHLVRLAEAVGAELRVRITAGHPGVAKAWAAVGDLESVPLVRAGFNVAGVTRSATGCYRVTFAPPFANGNYAVVAMAGADSPVGVTLGTRTAEGVDVFCVTPAGVPVDLAALDVVVFS